MSIKERLVDEISLLTSNPGLFLQHCRCRLTPNLVLPKVPVKKNINGVWFDFDLSLAPSMKKMYFGCYEIKLVKLMRNILKSGDVFIDVGANIGYLSALGAGLVGASGQVHSFEPIQKYFEKLKKMAFENLNYKIVVNQCALGENEGLTKIDITNLHNIGWNTMVPNLMIKETVKESFDVSVCRLDDYLKKNNLNNIALIKIDVEGFEFPILKGLSNYWENNNRPVIVCEIVPLAYPLLNSSLAQLVEYLKKYNYSAYRLDNPNIKIDITKLTKTTDVVFRSVDLK